MKLDQTHSFQFSIQTLLMVTVAVSVWISGFMYLIQMNSADYPFQKKGIDIFVCAFSILGMTLASTAFIFVAYGILLLMVFCGDQRAEQYCRRKLKIWLRAVLAGIVAAAPWLVVLARS